MTKELSESELYDYATYLSPLIKKILRTKPKQFDFLEEGHANVKQRITLLRFEALSSRSISYKGLKALPEERITTELKEWIDHLNYRAHGKPWFWQRWLGEGEQITVGDVYKVIKILANRWHYYPNLMMHRLRTLGCTFFDQSDSKFLQKRTRWIYQKTITWKHIRLELGHCFSDAQEVKTLVYKLRNVAQFVILSDNPVRLCLNSIDHALTWDQVSDPPILFLPPVLSGDGFQVFDRFDHRMSAPPWSSEKYRDFYISTIVTFVGHMLWHHYTPRALPVNSLGWIEGKLYTAEYLSMDRMHVGRIVQWIRRVASGSESVYKEILVKTKLAYSPEYEFFEQLLIHMNEKTVMEVTRKFATDSIFMRSLHWTFVAGRKFQREVKVLADEVGSEALLEAYRSHMGFGFVDRSWFF